MRYFTADEHFGSRAILAREWRPFKDVDEMNNAIIRNFNEQMTPGDTLYHVGDFMSYNKVDQDWLANSYLVNLIKAKSVLIIGNNEARVIKDFFEGSFEAFREYAMNVGFIEVYKKHTFYSSILLRPVHLVHEPTRCRSDIMNVFGHVHRAVLFTSKGWNAGIDIHHYRAISEVDLVRLNSQKYEFWDKDQDVISVTR